uniref:UNC80 domain-containing protein n=1 Tax=Mesocestoides corti TaxID=53468 RepID=A0A5K3FKF7_MESCO
MRLKIPQPVQTWFNTRRHLQLEKAEDQSDESACTTTIANPVILEAIQNLCYEIFALPVCTTEAINVAQTICGHIYYFAQSTNSGLQQLVMDLLPTLLHVYLVITTLLSGGLSYVCADEHAATRPCTISTPSSRTFLSSNGKSMRARKSLRERLKKPGSSSSAGGVATTTTPKFRRPMVSSAVKDRTRRIFAGLTPNAETTGGSTASSELTAGTNLATLSAILEALLLGLYNTYASQKRFATPSYFTLPPFSDGSVFSGPLPVSEVVRRRAEALARSSAHDSGLAPFPYLEEITHSNRWHFLRFLCRLSTGCVGDLSERGREALCHLACLLGPSGLRDHSLPERLLDATTSTPTPRQGSRSWKNFGRRRHRRHQHRPTSRHRARADRLDIACITAPLQSAAMQTAKEEEELGHASRLDGREESENASSQDVHSCPPVEEAEEGAVDSVVVEEEGGPNVGEEEEEEDDDDEDVSALSEFQTTTSTPEELASNGSIYSDDEVVALEEEEEEDSGLRHIPNTSSPVSNGRRTHYESNSSNVKKRLPTLLNANCNETCDEVPSASETEEEVEEDDDDNVAFEVEEGEDDGDGDDLEMGDAVTANSCPPSPDDLTSATASDALPSAPPPSPPPPPPPPLPPAPQPPAPASPPPGKAKRKTKSTSVKKGDQVDHFEAARSTPRPRMSRIPYICSQFVIDLLPGLHYILATPQAHLAVSAIHELTTRATIELWSNVLLFVNGVSNSKFFLDAVHASAVSRKSGCCATTSITQLDQTNQSNTATSAVSVEQSPALSLDPLHHRHLPRPFPPSSSEDEQHSFAGVTGRHPCKTVITNASFQTVRPEEDIPLVKVPGPAEVAPPSWLPPPTPPPPQRIRPKSLSPRPSLASRRPPQTLSPRDIFLRLNCTNCGTSRTLEAPSRHRPQSFNARVS